MAVENRVIKPQDGFQTKFLSSKADIVFAGSGAGCFAKDTLVKTVKGYKPIQDIEVGEYVLSYNEITKQKENKLVVETFTHNTIAISKKMIIFVLDNNIIIRCTENHEFYFRGNWVSARELFRRKMGVCEQHFQSLFSFKQWETGNCKLEKQQQVCNNETSIRQTWILQNDAKDVEKWRVSFPYNKSTSNSNRTLQRKRTWVEYGKSHRHESSKQSYRQLGVDRCKRQFSPLNKKHGSVCKKYWQQKNIETFNRVSNRHIDIKRKTSARDKGKIQTNNLYARDVSKGISGFNRLYQRDSELQKLEAFEIKLSDIKEIILENINENVYDLSVVDNNNYFITDNEILVHNCGKTYSLLMEPLRHITTVKGFGAVVFRRTTPQITNEGGLWDTSVGLYQTIAKQKESSREWIFNNGNKLKFSHLEYDKDAYSWQGSQIPFIGFDELTHFSKKQFFYLLSRNRSVCGVKPYVRATLNPDPDSWVAEFIEWYIDQKTGYPIKEHIGKLRYFMLNSGEICWGNTKQEVYEKQKHTIDTLIESNEGSSMEDYIKSFSFITGSIYENKELMRANPDYLSNLLAQSEEDQLRLLYGNWKHVTNDNELYNYEAFKSMFSSLKNSKTGIFSITADIAMEGADKFVVGVWDGYELVDIKIINKSDGSIVVETIKEFANTYQVPNNRIVYDNDGVGSYLGGFIIYGIGFNNNGKPVLSSGKAYKNLKSQCYYVSSQNVNEYKVTISDKVANTRYDEKYTVKERFMYERRCIRKDKPDYDQKLAVIPKQEMKPLIGGDSPDLMDMFMLRARLELVPKF